MAPTAEELKAQLQDGFDQADDYLTQLHTKFDAGVKHVNNDPSFLILPPIIMDKIREKLNEINGYLQKLDAALTEFREHHMPIVSLIDKGFAWLEDVQEELELIASEMKMMPGRGTWDWEGKAAGRYEKIVPVQRDAVLAMSEKATVVSEWLVGVAEANILFVLDFVDAVLEHLEACVAAAIDAASVIGVLEAVGTLSGVLAGMWAAVPKWFNNSLRLFSQSLGGLQRLEAEKNRVRDLPGGAWPQSVDPDPNR